MKNLREKLQKKKKRKRERDKEHLVMEDQRSETCDQSDEKTIVLLYPLVYISSSFFNKV